MGRVSDRQTDRQTDEQTDQWKNRETNKLTNIWKMDRKTYRYKGIRMERQIDRQTKIHN